MTTAARYSKGLRADLPTPTAPGGAGKVPAWGSGARASLAFPRFNALVPRQHQSVSSVNAAVARSPALQPLSPLVGTTITLATKTDQCYEGIVASIDGMGDMSGVALKDARDVTMPHAPLRDSIFIASTNIKSYLSGLADAKRTIIDCDVPSGTRETGTSLSIPASSTSPTILTLDSTPIGDAVHDKSSNGTADATVSAAQSTFNLISSKAPSTALPAVQRIVEDPIIEFREFIRKEKQRLMEKKQALARSEMNKRMADLDQSVNNVKDNQREPISTQHEERQRETTETPPFSNSPFSNPHSSDSTASAESNARDAENTPSAAPSSASASMFSSAQNTVINGGTFSVRHEADQRTMITVNTGSHNMVPYSLVAFQAMVSGVTTFSKPPIIEKKPPPLIFDEVVLYRSPFPVYYEDLPILFAPFLFAYLWKFVFGMSSRVSG